MTIEIFRAVTPWLTFFLVFVVGLIGFFLKFMIAQNQRHFQDLKEKIEDLESDIREIDKGHQKDKNKILEKYVDKESFYMAIGKQEGVISKIFEQLKELSATLNQTIGAFNARKDNG